MERSRERSILPTLFQDFSLTLFSRLVFSLPLSPVKQLAKQIKPKMIDAQTSSNMLSLLDTSSPKSAQTHTSLGMLPLVCPGISKTPQHIQNISDVSVMRSRSTGYPSHYQANFLREVREKLDSIKKGSASLQKQPNLPGQAVNRPAPNVSNVSNGSRSSAATTQPSTAAL